MYLAGAFFLKKTKILGGASKDRHKVLMFTSEFHFSREKLYILIIYFLLSVEALTFSWSGDPRKL